MTLLNLAIGFSFRELINNYAHVGGLVSGFVISLVFVPANRRPDERVDSWLRVGVAVLFALLTIWSAVPAFRPEASNALAYTLVLNGRRIERATQVAEEARRLAPDDGMIEGTLAVCYLRQGRAREAVPLLEDAVRRHDNDELRAIDTLWLALAKEKSGDRAGARRMYSEALKSRKSLTPDARAHFEIVRREVTAELQRAR